MSPVARPKYVGGTLIRRIIKIFRDNQVSLPLNKVAIACSGGVDSFALAHLVSKYGRRIVSKQNILLVHINHGWRGPESDGDQNFVETYCEDNGVRFRNYTLTVPTKKDLKNQSPELLARNERKKIYSDLEKEGYFVLTAHHSDDVAETLIWRLCSGKMEGYEAGILFNTGNEMRPFLTSRKDELKEFLSEEGLSWREDRTNFDGKLLRSKMRMKLIPVLSEIFPDFVEKINREAGVKRAGRRSASKSA
jgi:tRNA(Ile)-lysidine synthase